MQVQKEWLDFLREQYPKGSRIRLTEMKDDPYALSPGSMGTLDHIDDAGQFHVKWDNGSGLALIIGEDRFQVQLPEPQTLKFYMPITAQLYGRDSWGDLEEYGNDLNGRDLRDYSGSAWRCRSELLPKPARHRDEESSCRRKADDALHPRQP